MSHYISFFDLKENPFVLTPDPKYLYLGGKHREVLGHLLYGVREEKGFMVVVGEVGTGKTTLCRAFINQLLKENIEIGLIYNPAMTDLELLQAINREFKIPSDLQTKGKLIDALNDFLLKVNGEGRKVVLIIDEAQNLYPSVLEQIRLISNLETETGKLIQIILVGQPELERILSKKEMRQLDQRIVVRGLLEPLKRNETVEYIQHRLKVASNATVQDPISFSKVACKKIHRYSGGIPRLTNVIADRTLLVAYSQERRDIDKPIVKKAYHDLESSRYRDNPRPFSLRWQTGVIFIILMIAFWSAWQYMIPVKTDKVLTPKLTAVQPVVKANIKKAQVIATPDPRIFEEKEKPKEIIMELFSPVEAISRKENWHSALRSIITLWNETMPGEWEEGIETGFFPKDTNLNMLEIYGNLTLLSSMNYPAIVELKKPESDSKVFWVLKKLKDTQVILIGEHEKEIPLEIFNSLWMGHAYIFWKDFENLPEVIFPGTSSVAVTWLQHNLAYLKLFKNPVTGFYGASTKEAIVNLQKKNSLGVDGIVGPQTKMIIYSLLDIYPKPLLTDFNLD